MHPATTALLHLLDGDRLPYARAGALARAIALDGGPADVPVLLDAFLADPSGREVLVAPLVLLGGPGEMRRVHDAMVKAGRLRDGMPADILWGLGWHGLEEAEALLFDHAREAGGDLGTREAVSAALGLLHLPCRGLEAAIREAILDCAGKNLFPEFLPALATKAGDPGLLDRVIAMGRETASQDCMGGIILAPALAGDAARFLELLWDPAFAAGDGSTGNVTWSHLGLEVLGLRLGDLFNEVKGRLSRGAGAPLHDITLLAGLLEKRLSDPLPTLRFAPPRAEGFADLHAALFEWSTPHRDDGLIGIAADTLRGDPAAGRMSDWLYGLEERAYLRMQEEVRLGGPHRC